MQRSTHLCFVLLPDGSVQVVSIFVATARVAQRQLARLPIPGLSAPSEGRETIASGRRSLGTYRRSACRVRMQTNACSKHVKTLSVSEREAQSRAATEGAPALAAPRSSLSQGWPRSPVHHHPHPHPEVSMALPSVFIWKDHVFSERLFVRLYTCIHSVLVRHCTVFACFRPSIAGTHS
jgi:hypothetical protein